MRSKMIVFTICALAVGALIIGSNGTVQADSLVRVPLQDLPGQLGWAEIVVTRTSQGSWQHSQATVTVLDDKNAPVANAIVVGGFTGPTSGKQSKATNSDGKVVFTSDGSRNPSGEWCFEVANLTHATLTYNSALNVGARVCESGVAFSNPPSRVRTSDVNDVTSVYPNPFNTGANITFRLTESSNVDVTVYNIIGQAVRHLVSGYYSEGTHSVHFDGNNDRGDALGTGIYFYRFQNATKATTRKMLLLK